VPGPGHGPDRFFNGVRTSGWYRSNSRRMVGGVCAGLAERLGVDPVIVRVGFVLLSVITGIGFLIYVAALAFLPDETGRILAEEGLRRGNGKGVLVLVVLGIAVASEIADRTWFYSLLPFAVVAWWVLRRRQQGADAASIRAEAQSRVAGLADTVQGWVQPPPWQAQPGGPAYPASTPPSPEPTAPAAPPPPTPLTAPAPYGIGPGRTGTPMPTLPPLIVRERRRRGGLALLVTAVGVGLAAYGAGLWDTASWPSQRSVSLALACAAGAIGLLLLVAALKGLRAPFVTLVAMLLLLASIAVAAKPTGLAWASSTGDQVWTPVSGPAQTYALGIGQARLDLTQLTAAGSNGQQLTASVNLGELDIVVPEGLTVRVDARVGLGQVTRPGPRTDTAGTDVTDSVTLGSGDPDVIVNASVDIGEIKVTTTSARPGTTSGPTSASTNPTGGP
jgi:phage shock protein PspC (stress-responsive transcriptional regulator)